MTQWQWRNHALEVPDGFNSITAYRAWNVKVGPFNAPFLASTGVNATWWEAGPREARCLQNGNHEAPNPTCQCGFWGLFDYRLLPRSDVDSYVYGLINMWGRIVVGQHGYRSQYTEITGFISFTATSLYRRLAKIYQVPIYKFPEDLPEVTNPDIFLPPEPEISELEISESPVEATAVAEKKHWWRKRGPIIGSHGDLYWPPRGSRGGGGGY